MEDDGGQSTQATDNLTHKPEANLAVNQSGVRMILSEKSSSETLPLKQGFLSKMYSTLFGSNKLPKQQSYSHSQWCKIKTEHNSQISSSKTAIKAKQNFTIAFWPQAIQSGFSKEILFKKLSDFGVSFGIGEAKILKGEIIGVDTTKTVEYHSCGDTFRNEQLTKSEGYGYKQNDKLIISVNLKTVEWSHNGERRCVSEHEIDKQKKWVAFVRMSTRGDSFVCCK